MSSKERELLQRARRGMTPAKADRERIAGLLSAKLGVALPLANAAVTNLAETAPPAAASPALSSSLSLGQLGAGKALALGLVVGGVIGFQGARFLSDHDSAPQLSGMPLIASAARGSEPKEASTHDVKKTSIVTFDELPSKSVREPRATSGAFRAVTPGASAVPSLPSAEELSKDAGASSVTEELLTLRRARSALNVGNSALALGLVRELDELFPRGVLMEERETTRILSLCALGRHTEAASAEARFLERQPSSVYAERITKSCAFTKIENSETETPASNTHE